MKNRTSIPDYYSILQYWGTHKDKRFKFKFTIDLGEPTCFGCCNGFNGKYDFTCDDEKTIKKLVNIHWARAGLERCHIIPKSLGGSFETSNIIPMCGYCHETSPDTSIEYVFTDWHKNNKNVWDRNIDLFKSEHGEYLPLLEKHKKHIFSNQGTGYTLNDTLNKWIKKRTAIHAGCTSPNLASYLPMIKIYLKEVKNIDV